MLQSSAGKYSRQQVLALPAALHLAAIPASSAEQADIAEQFRCWLQQEHRLKSSVSDYQFEPEGMLLDIGFKRPAGYASVQVDFAQGTVALEEDFAGYLALLNELHKDRNAGLSWLLLLDLTAIACILFSITGLMWRYG